jgi:hypothetical protein
MDNNNIVMLNKEKILAAKSLITMRKRFLSDVMTNRKNLAPQTLGNLIKKIDRYGKKDLFNLYHEVKSILYGDVLKMSVKKDKAGQIQNIFPFAGEVFEPMNTSIKMYEPKISSTKFKNVAEAVEFNLNNKKFNKMSDFETEMKHIKKSVLKQLNSLFIKYGPIKVIFSIEAEIIKDVLDGIDITALAMFNSASSKKSGTAILNQKQLEGTYADGIEKIKKDMEEYLQNGSEWKFKAIKRFFIKVTKYQSFNGSSYIELPEYINNKKCVINIKNDDDKCFIYSVLCGMFYDEIEHHHQRVSKYKPYLDKINVEGLNCPMSIDDIGKFEELNNIPINVFMLNDDHDENNEISQHFNVIYFHTIKNEKKPINLLLIENEDKRHYCFIKNIRGFVRCKNTESLIVCDKCFRCFRLQSAYDNHIKKNKCQFTQEAVKVLPDPNAIDEKTKKIKDPECHISKFKNHHKKLPVPFVIYADGESILNKINDDKNKNTQVYQNHQVYNIGCKFVSEFPDKLQDEYKEFTGENCMIDFLKYVFEMTSLALTVLNPENQEKMKMTKNDWIDYNHVNNCYLCNKILDDKECIYEDGESKDAMKVRDHCHMTGKYRGAACNKCNLSYNYKNFKLPVIFHNLKGYDSHFILQYIGKLQGDKNLNISVIPNTMEKYMSFTIDKTIFLDSLQFLSASLESLVEALNKSNDESLFKYFNEGFKSSTSELKDLLRQKGVFPYDWYDNKDKLNYLSLPSKEDFYNNLNESKINDDDYLRALKVFDVAKCKNFGEYLSLYLKCDVLLLADVFEAFRKMCLNNYGLDPCHYFTSPGFSWDAMLNMTQVNIQCFKEGQEDMLDMIENNMRGGISMISNRYAKANNKYMQDYNPNEDSSYIMYLDANNLYGWAMSQPLPTGNYKWENPNDFDVETIKISLERSNPTGYIFDVDLDVPEDLHDYFNDYPLAPESRLGEYSDNIIEKYKLIHGKEPKSTVKKLIPNLNNKKNYVLHIKNLQLYLSLGMKLIKINRVLSFDQEPFLSKYIDFNTSKRAATKNDYEKDLFKLMNNSVFGKTMENVAKHIDVKLMTNEKKFVKQCSMPNFKDFRIFSEGLAAIEMNKTQVVYNKPMIVGFCILELSKVLMYDFHYNTMKKQYGDNIKLLFTDTDSLCYHVKTNDFYDDMKESMKDYDTSDYPKNHSCFSNVNKKVIGKFKDEANSKPIIEFCGLRAKMYTFLTEEKGKSVAKGIKKNQIKKLKMEEYKRVLFGETKEDLTHKVSFNLLRSSNHQMNSIRVCKTGLSGIDDKRHVLDDNIHTYALGHKNI